MYFTEKTGKTSNTLWLSHIRHAWISAAKFECYEHSSLNVYIWINAIKNVQQSCLFRRPACRNLLDVIKNILEQHEGELMITEISFMGWANLNVHPCLHKMSWTLTFDFNNTNFCTMKLACIYALKESDGYRLRL